MAIAEVFFKNLKQSNIEEFKEKSVSFAAAFTKKRGLFALLEDKVQFSRSATNLEEFEVKKIGGKEVAKELSSLAMVSSGTSIVLYDPEAQDNFFAITFDANDMELMRVVFDRDDTKNEREIVNLLGFRDLSLIVENGRWQTSIMAGCMLETFRSEGKGSIQLKFVQGSDADASGSIFVTYKQVGEGDELTYVAEPSSATYDGHGTVMFDVVDTNAQNNGVVKFTDDGTNLKFRSIDKPEQ
eukprot:GHVS01025991.1.p2 GENE.GHVS01025991.1~~GHVS01025991.1.p2  ORF type:complete len:241 (+),score=29.53 GHVS01025991.1:1314-2036(+)